MGEKGAKQRHQTGERRQACHKRNGKNCNQISKEQQKWKAEPIRAAVTEKETPEVLQLEGIWWGSYTERRVDNQRREGSFWKRYIKAGMSWDSQLREAAVVSTSLTARAKYKKHLHWGGGCGTAGRILVLSPVEEKQGNSHFWVC